MYPHWKASLTIAGGKGGAFFLGFGLGLAFGGLFAFSSSLSAARSASSLSSESESCLQALRLTWKVQYTKLYETETDLGCENPGLA